VPEDEPQVVRRVYPANTVVQVDDTTVEHRACLAILTKERVYIWTEQGGAITPALDVPYVRPEGRMPHVSELRTAPLIVDLADGGRVEVRAAAGCGCGSSLKSFAPFARDVSGPAR
jgi:hypothetical protein